MSALGKLQGRTDVDEEEEKLAGGRAFRPVRLPDGGILDVLVAD